MTDNIIDITTRYDNPPLNNGVVTIIITSIGVTIIYINLYTWGILVKSIDKLCLPSLNINNKNAPTNINTITFMLSLLTNVVLKNQ